VTERRSDDARDWHGGWDAHRQAQRARMADETTPAQRLAWLEEMIVLAHRSGALPRRRPSDDGS